MRTINVKVTRKWIKDLRATGMTNAEIIEDTFGRIARLEKTGPCELANRFRADLKLAGLIGD